jgi:putative hydrolase of the HAD superfamily
MKPAVVIFDMDDVLCRYDLGKRLRVLSRITGQTPRDIRAAIWDSGFEDDADSGGYFDPDHYLAEFSRRIGHSLTREDWVTARREAMVPWPDMLSLAKRIGEQARTAVYTNNGPLTKAALRELFPEVTTHFNEHYFSFEFSTKKPDPGSYRKLMDRMGVTSDQCWFIDDKRSNVTGARMAGIRGHHFRSLDQLVSDARGLGFEA